MVLALGGLVAARVYWLRSSEESSLEHRYTDPELGFSFVVREGWGVDAQAAASYRQYLERARAQDAGAALELLQRQRSLVSVGKKDFAGKQVGRLSVFASKLPPAEFLGTYLAGLQQQPAGPPPPEIHEQKQGHEIRGRRYDLVRLTVDLGGTKVMQELFATAAGSESVLFVLTAGDAAALAELKAMMWSTEWSAVTSPR